MTASRPTRVLQVVDSLGMGGAETWLIEVLKYFAQTKKYEIDFFATSGKRGILDDEAEALGATIYYGRFGRAHLGSFTRKFRKVLSEGCYDAIHDHADYASGIHFLLALGRLPPVRITHIHNTWLHIEANYGISWARKLTARIGKFFIRRITTHVCGTSSDVLRLYGFPIQSDKEPLTFVLHCGFDVGRFNAPREPDRASVIKEFGWNESARIVLFAGRLDRALECDHPQNQKNSWLALNVLRSVAEKDKSVCFLMAGAGDAQRLEMQKHITSWGLSDRLRLIGIRKDLPRLMRASDMLFFPSRQEGLGMVAVEAQAVGLPVLASDGVPVAANIIPQLYRSLPVRSSIAEWTDAVLATLNTPKVPLEIARRVIERSKFSIETSAQQLTKIYDLYRS